MDAVWVMKPSRVFRARSRARRRWRWSDSPAARSCAADWKKRSGEDCSRVFSAGRKGKSSAAAREKYGAPTRFVMHELSNSPDGLGNQCVRIKSYTQPEEMSDGSYRIQGMLEKDAGCLSPYELIEGEASYAGLAERVAASAEVDLE